MSDHSAIEWCDTTWNFVTGCTKISPGCDNCYIERTPPFRMQHRRFDRPGIGGTTGIRLHSDRLALPLRWRKPRRVFVNSLADLFHDQVPARFIAEAFAVMSLCPQHRFQILTKRPARMRSLLNSAHFWESVDGALAARGKARLAGARPAVLPNVWLGVSTEDQKRADLRIPALLETPAAVRWLSCEPLLGPLNLDAYLRETLPVTDPLFDAPDGALVNGMVRCADEWYREDRIDWVVAGGESGLASRPMQPDWARSLRDQCTDAGVPFLFKQWGGRTPKANGRELDGREWNEYPETAAAR